MSLQTKHIYEFGPFRLDAAEHLLLRDGEAVPLTPKAFDLLLALVERHGHLLEKEELLKKVWPDTFVEEANLASNISQLRRALGDGANGERYIETIPKRGYRFITNVRESDRAGEIIGADQPAAQSITANEELRSNSGETAPALAPSSPKSLFSKIKRLKQRLVIVLLALGPVIAAVAYSPSLIRQKFRSDQPALRHLSQLTYGAGLQGEPTWSPDGRLLAYSSDQGGNFDIWVQQVSSGDPVQVTKSPAPDWQPDWSPDGTSIVFRSERDGGGLFVAPALGGSARKVSSFGYHPKWSKDGSRILFFGFHLQTGVAPRKAYVVALDGELPREVQPEFLGEFLIYGLDGVAWHPDGQRISIWGYHAKFGLGFWTMPLTGGAAFKSEISAEVEKQLKEAAVSLQKFLWAPSGRYLYFEGEARGVRNLWRITVDPQTLGWVAGPERLTTDAGLDTDIGLSTDGKKLAYTIRTESSRLWSFPLNASTGKIEGDGQPVTPAGMSVPGGDLSSDGKKLSYGMWRAGKVELRVKSLEDGRETLLAVREDIDPLSYWSRDGTRLVGLRYHSRNPDGSWPHKYSNVIYPAGGGAEIVLTSQPPPAVIAGDWSADGQWVLGNVIPRDKGRSLIRLLQVAAAPHAETQARIVTSSEEYNLYCMRLSPDDRWVSFNAVMRGAGSHPSTIYLVPAKGGDWIRITEGRYWDDKPRWAPDGKMIFFISDRSGLFNVWGIRLNPVTGKPIGRAFQVTAFESPGQMIYPYLSRTQIAVSEHRLVLPMMEALGNIWVLENVDR